MRPEIEVLLAMVGGTAGLMFVAAAVAVFIAAVGEVRGRDRAPSGAPADRATGGIMPPPDDSAWAVVRWGHVLYWTTGQDSGRPLCEYEEAA